MKPTLAITAASVLLLTQLASAGPSMPGGVPPGEPAAKEALNTSPRHGEWVEVTVPGQKVPMKTWIVYPERKEKAPVVIVIQEIFGLSDWIRSVADQLAADGFIAIAPDMLSGHGKDGGGTDSYPSRDDVTKAVRGLGAEEVMTKLNAAREFGNKLPSASGKTATVGYCWGGGQSFAFAAAQPDLSAAVVYYGTPPTDQAMKNIKAPVLGFYGGDDNRVTSTVKPTEAAMKKLGKPYSPNIFEGAGHGFLRAQDKDANVKAAKEAWPKTIAFLKENTK